MLETLFDITQLPEDVQVLYQSLAPACQREWASSILSAVQQTTKEMSQTLRQGKKIISYSSFRGDTVANI
ncbi:hypothetical protein NHG23_07025 [Aerococcaceae bacterium NML190073]|nr:hypothetical protein [Aerococcaceae bacterium NML190073]